jgi:hypothetical protein
MKRLWRNYSLSITLAGLFFVSWIGQLVTQWFTWANDQQEHNQPLEVGDFLWQFWTSTLENWQSEFLQLLTFVVLTTYLIHCNSHESRDSDDKMQKTLNRIEQRLKALEGEGARPRRAAAADREVPSWRTPPPRSCPGWGFRLYMQRLLALAAAIWWNWELDAPNKRSLVAYGH